MKDFFRGNLDVSPTEQRFAKRRAQLSELAEQLLQDDFTESAIRALLVLTDPKRQATYLQLQRAGDTLAREARAAIRARQ